MSGQFVLQLLSFVGQEIVGLPARQHLVVEVLVCPKFQEKVIR